MQIDKPQDLGLRMRDQRLSLRMSQAMLAESIGVSRSWVFQMERGNPGAAIGLVLKALQVLGLTLDVRLAERSAEAQSPGVEEPFVPDLAAILDRARGRNP